MAEARRKWQQRPSWKDLPAFLDASASVSATTFGARRLPELKALWNIQQQQDTRSTREFESGGGKTSSRHLRRRTTSHKTRKWHRYPRGTHPSSTSKPPSRRARRKRALLCQTHENWSDKTQVSWLTTHLWHAKRFHMETLFGWKVPLLHTNRGARSALRMLKEGFTTLQDVTWRIQPLVVQSSDLPALVNSLKRICPNLSGNCSFGQAMLHEPDRFPMGAIGPVLWFIYRMDDSSPLEKWCLYLLVRPASRDAVRDAVHVVLPNNTEGPRHLQQGLCCFQLRGQCATKTLMQALSPTGNSGDYDWDRTRTVDDLHTRLPHLTAISVNVSPADTACAKESDTLAATDGNDDCLSYIDEFTAALLDPSTSISMSGSCLPVGESQVILVSQRPCDPSMQQNAGVCGWDIFCHSCVSKDIFVALAERGNARVVGLVEEAHVQMESEPPLPVFPRDYPDTRAGQSYWKDEDWKILRHYLEQGWGRVRVANPQDTAGRSNHVPCWNHISTLPENATTIDDSAGLAVVRGDFGNPFLDVLNGCGHIPTSEHGKAKRRPRRRVQPPSASVPLRALSDDDASAHKQLCSTLLQSLSLPAIIFSHVTIEGKGTIVAGQHLCVSMKDSEEPGHFDFLIGETVAGSFSTSRGAVHGVCFVGAARLLRALSTKKGRDSCVAVRQPDGVRHVELKVTVKGTSSQPRVDRSGTLSLLL